MPDYSNLDDQAVIAGLNEHGLFHVLRPETVVDSDAAHKLETAMTEIMESGALDSLSKENTAFHQLSRSRLGGDGDTHLATEIFEKLKARNLAKDSEDGVSIPMHPKVRSLVLILLAQILRPQGEKLGLDLAPATDQPLLVNALCELLSRLPSAPSHGHVITFDMKTVGVDLGRVPIDEVLAFRKETFADHREYSLAVRKFVRELGEMPAKEQAAAFEQRQADLDEIANELARRSMKNWKTNTVFMLGMAGAAWAYLTSNPIGAIISGAATLLKTGASDAPDYGSFSDLVCSKGPIRPGLKFRSAKPELTR